MQVIKRLRQRLCPHNDTYEERENLETVTRQGVRYDVNQQVSWKCNSCGKETRHTTKKVL